MLASGVGGSTGPGGRVVVTGDGDGVVGDLAGGVLAEPWPDQDADDPELLEE